MNFWRRANFVGTKNCGGETRLRTIKPDKKTFNKVKEILRAFATSEYTLTKIQSKMFSLGLVGKDEKLPHLSTIHKILTKYRKR